MPFRREVAARAPVWIVFAEDMKAGCLSMVWALLVDDDAPTRDALRLALEDVGYVVLEAADGGQALDLLRRSRRRLVALVALVDLLMPATPGTDLLRLVAQEQGLARRRRFIAMTAQ
ncbi:MAG TPA: response regulator [Ktedonobacterales bacterium]|nr:response regulator [Ktedonobacterales bacterium]